jgi:hypothetical protein
MLLEESAHGQTQCTNQTKAAPCWAVQDSPRRNEFRRGVHNNNQSELGLLGAAASLGFIAALRTFRAALLHGGTTGFVFGAAFLALLATAELRIGHAAGAWLSATGQLERATIFGLFVGSQDATHDQDQDKTRSGQVFRKHGTSPVNELANKRRSERSNEHVDAPMKTPDDLAPISCAKRTGERAEEVQFV